MGNDISLGLIYASALAVLGMLLVWGLPMGAISLTRSLAALQARRARHARRSAFHRRLRSQGVQPLTRAAHAHRLPTRAS
jgi:cytochrome c-type biogenesis protein CcmH/NrfF